MKWVSILSLANEEQKIVEKTSARLRVHGETWIPMFRDHQDIARYESPANQDYQRIVDQLQACAEQFGPWARKVWKVKPDNSQAMFGFLGIQSAPDCDVSFYIAEHRADIPKLIQTDQHIATWFSRNERSRRILLLYGGPGSGKSVLASHIVRYVKDTLQQPCNYFFFQEQDGEKQSIVSLYRSIAFQIANQFQKFRYHLLSLAESGYSLDSDTDESIWRKLFAHVLPKLDFADNECVYWIIDGIDLCASPQSFLLGLNDPTFKTLPLRILILSRPNQLLSQAFGHPDAVALDFDTIPFKRTLIRNFVKAQIGEKHPLLEEIVDCSEGNFQWTSLVVSKLRTCYTKESVAQVLDMRHHSFDSLWNHIVLGLQQQWQPDERRVVEFILAWAVCGQVPLTAAQMEAALTIQGFDSFGRIDLHRLCGALIKVDQQSCIRLSHRTVRHYLMEAENCNLHINSSKVHGVLLRTCLKAIHNTPEAGDCTPQSCPFTDYAIVSWEYHLRQSAACTDHELLLSIKEFLTGATMTKWIYMLAKCGQLNLLVSASSTLAELQLKMNIAHNESGMPNLQQHGMKDRPKRWARELLGIFGKFGKHILRHPKAIYQVVPPFCPRTSLIREHFALQTVPNRIIIKGESSQHWDDIIARLPAPRSPSRVVCTSQHAAISSVYGDGEVLISCTDNPFIYTTISHEEPVQGMCFSNAGNMLATVGYGKMRVWLLPNELIRDFDLPAADHILDMTFTINDMAVLLCTKGGQLWKFLIASAMSTGQVVASIVADEGSGKKALECAAFDQTASRLIVSSDSPSIRAWSLSSEGNPEEQRRASLDDVSSPQTNVAQIKWISAPDRVLTIHKDGSAWVWDPNGNHARQIVSSGATCIQSSPTGVFLAVLHRDKRLSLRKADDLSIIYTRQLDHDMKDFTISPNGCCIYVLRQSACDVWSPACLYPLALSTHGRYSDSSEDTMIDNTERDSPAPIELLSIGPRTNLYFTAHARGDLKLFNVNGSHLCSLKASYSISILEVSWSRDEEHFAFLDDTNRISILRIANKKIERMTNVLEFTPSDTVRQLLFLDDSNSILILTEHSMSILAFKSKEAPTYNITVQNITQIIICPQNPGVLFAFGPDYIDVFRSDNLERLDHLIVLSKAQPNNANGPAGVTTYGVVNTFVGTEGSEVLIQASGNHESIHNGILSINIADIRTSRQEHRTTVTAIQWPQAVSERIYRTLGYINAISGKISSRGADNGWAFIDKNGCLCTINSDMTLRDHMFLPTDWLELDSLRLIKVTPDGTLFVPHRGKVSIVINAFRTSLE
jgi:WD40 repeat protein